MKELGIVNVMEVPKITKITVNMGVGEAVADKKIVEAAAADLTKITGQKPKLCSSRKSIASFKLREGLPIGCKIIFPEIQYDQIDQLRGMDITITTTAKDDKAGRALLDAFSFPFRK